MRSSSRRPWPSNRHNSTFSALAENSAKFVPLPSQLAPRREDVPPLSRILSFRHEEDGSQRRDREIEFGYQPFRRPDLSDIPDIGAAIVRGVGIQHLTPLSGEGHSDPIIVIDVWREIHDNEA